MSWKWLTLADILIPQKNGKPVQQGWSPRCHTHPAAQGRWGVLKTTAIQEGQFDPSHNKELPDGLEPRPQIEVKAGDLLMTCAGPRARCGVPALVRHTPERLLMSGKMYRFRPDDRVLPRFLEMWLLNPATQKLIDGMKTGISDSGLNLTHGRFVQLPIPVPPLAEQHRIVDALEDHLSRLDAAESILRASRNKATALRSRAIEAALEGPADCARDTVSERLERIAELRRSRVAQRRKTATPPAYQLNLPPGWTTASVDELCWQIQYGTSKKADAVGSDTHVPVLRMGNIQDGDIDVNSLKYIPADDPSLSDLLLEPGDLLFNRTNSAELVGKTAVFGDQLPRATFASYLIRCRTIPGVSAQWISLIANSSIGRRYIESVMSQQVGQANVNGTKLAAMPIPITTEDAEDALLEQVVELRRSGARLVGEVDDCMKRSTVLRRSLLRAAFNGELVDQDPADEPAAVALERLRAEAKPTGKRATKRTTAAST